MAADRQVTGGESIVMHKDLNKVNQINDYLVISWCGGASDALMLSKLLNAELKLKELKSKKRPTIREAANLAGTISFKNIRQPSMIPSIVATLVAGFDEDGSTSLYSVSADGGVYTIKDYDASMGSGMPYMLGLLERQYQKGINIEQGVKLALESLKSSTQRDVASGYGMDVFVITKEGIKKVVDKEITPNYN
jgi:20S proteasome alpha/beta subunit